MTTTLESGLIVGSVILLMIVGVEHKRNESLLAMLADEKKGMQK